MNWVHLVDMKHDVADNEPASVELEVVPVEFEK
jgi:hypothetical protein